MRSEKLPILLLGTRLFSNLKFLFLSIYTPRLTVRMLIVQEQGVQLQCEVNYCRFNYLELDYFRIQNFFFYQFIRLA